MHIHATQHEICIVSDGSIKYNEHKHVICKLVIKIYAAPVHKPTMLGRVHMRSLHYITPGMIGEIWTAEHNGGYWHPPQKCQKHYTYQKWNK